MQIREAEHRHRAELAAEQERVREAHEMVELIQSGMPRSHRNFDIERRYGDYWRLFSGPWAMVGHGGPWWAMVGHELPALVQIPQQAGAWTRCRPEGTCQQRCDRGPCSGGGAGRGCRWLEDFATVNPG